MPRAKLYAKSHALLPAILNKAREDETGEIFGCVGGGGGVGADSGRVLVVRWLWAGGGGLCCCEGVLIRAKIPNHPNQPNQSNQPKNPESAESVESAKKPRISRITRITQRPRITRISQKT